MSPKSRIALGISFMLLISLVGLRFALEVFYPFMWGMFAFAVAGIVAWLFIDRKTIIDFLTMKTTKQGLNMGVICLMATVILVVVNFLAARHNSTFDFSSAAQFTLSDQSKKIIDTLDADLNVKFFYKEGLENTEPTKKSFTSLMKVYQDYSPKIKFEVVEMNSKPKLSEEFGATKGAGEGFVEYKGKKNRVEGQFNGPGLQSFSEQDFTNALIKTTRKEKKNIYIVQGHAERNFDSEKDETGTFFFKQMLEKNSYNVNSLSLIDKGGVPSDAHALLILGPLQSFQPVEIQLLEKYLEDGGALLITLDQKYTAQLDPLLTSLGLQLEKHYVFNIFNSELGQVVKPTEPTVAVHYSETSDITRQFKTNQSTIFFRPNSLKITSTPANMTADILVKTPEASVALKELDSQDYEGKPQPYNLAVEVKGKYGSSDKEFRVLVFADTDFISNSYLFQYINRDLALNSVSSLAKETDLVSLAPKEIAASKMLLTPPEFANFFRFVVVGIFLPLPFVFLLIGVLMWFRRRHA